MEMLDSRRLTGRGLLLDGPGAVVEIKVDDDRRDAAIAAWREAATRMLGAVGWDGERLAVRRYRGGTSLAFTAPMDALYAATDLNEWAWGAAADSLASGERPRLEGQEFVAAVERLRATIAEERRPALLAIHDAARGARDHLSRWWGRDLAGERQGRDALAGGHAARPWPDPVG